MLLSLSFQTRIRKVGFQARYGNYNPLLSKVESVRATNTERVRERQAKSNCMTGLSSTNCDPAFEEDPGPHYLRLRAIVHHLEGKVVNRPSG